MFYCSLVQDHHKLLDNTTLQFFVVPFIYNELADFLARHDLWYRRHVFDTFANPQPFIPFPNRQLPRASALSSRLSVSSRSSGLEKDRDSSRSLRNSSYYEVDDSVGADRRSSSRSRGREGGAQGMGSMMVPQEEYKYAGDELEPELPPISPLGCSYRKLLEDYVTQAKYLFGFNIWKVEAWEEFNKHHPGGGASEGKKRVTGAPHQITAFVSRFGFGIEAEKAAIREHAGLADHEQVSYNEAPVQIDFEYHEVDLLGQTARGDTSKQGVFRSINARGVPQRVRSGERPGAPPQPNNPFLSLYLRKMSDGPDVNRAPIKVNYIEITSRKGRDPFHILVDGVKYGSFNRVVIEPLCAPNTPQQLTFPVSTFFPIAV